MGAPQKIDRETAASLLDWWAIAGVDALIDEAPRNWLAPPPAAPASPAPAAVAAAPAPLAVPETIAEFERWRTGADVPEAGWPGPRFGAEGQAGAALMIVVDCPDRDGLMGGAAGRLFDRMLAAIGLGRDAVYLAPLAVARPTSTRSLAEIEPLLAQLMHAQIRLAAPERLLLFGNATSRAILGTELAGARGSLHCVNHPARQTGVRAVASYHPRFLLERPAAKADAWRDLQLLTGKLP